MAAALASRFSRGGRSFLSSLRNGFSGLMNSSNGTMNQNILFQKQQQQRRTFIQMGTILKVVDNTGAKKVKCIKALTRKKGATLGDTIVVSVKDAMPNASVKKGSVVYGVVVRAAMQKSRVDGSQVKFDENAVVLPYTSPRSIGMNIRNSERRQIFGPVGSRVFGPVARFARTNISRSLL